MAVTYIARINAYAANVKGKQFVYAVGKHGPLAEILAQKSFEDGSRHQHVFEHENDYWIMKVYHAPSGSIYDVLIDEDDYDRVAPYKWYINVPQNARTLYVANDRLGKLHRYIMNVESSEDVVDHINRNGLDNRKENLRITTASMNSRNMDVKASNKFNHNGVCYEPPIGKHAGRYKATWMEGGKFHKKSFSEAKYADALERAIAFRKQKEQELGYLQQ